MKLTYSPKDYLVLYSSCRVIRGATRSVLVNLQKNKFDLVPNELVDHLLEETASKPILELLGRHDPASSEILDGYIEMIVRNSYGFIATEAIKMLHPAQSLSDQWDYPFFVGNAIIDYNDNHRPHIYRCIKELSSIGCHTLQLRFFKAETPSRIEEVVRFCGETGRFSGISIVMDARDSEVATEEHARAFVDRHPLVTELIVYNSSGDAFFRSGDLRYSVLLLGNQLSDKECGCVQPFYFNTEFTHYTESLKYNTCLNRKVGIDADGNIKNCPSMQQSFGNIREHKLADIICTDDFKAVWNVTKDKISGCCDCEFRHICTDCRAYLENPKDTYSKPLKCGYDPYSGKWEDWSLNPLKTTSIAFYNLTPQSR